MRQEPAPQVLRAAVDQAEDEVRHKILRPECPISTTTAAACTSGAGGMRRTLRIASALVLVEIGSNVCSPGMAQGALQRASAAHTTGSCGTRACSWYLLSRPAMTFCKCGTKCLTADSLLVRLSQRASSSSPLTPRAAASSIPLSTAKLKDEFSRHLTVPRAQQVARAPRWRFCEAGAHPPDGPARSSQNLQATPLPWALWHTYISPAPPPACLPRRWSGARAPPGPAQPACQAVRAGQRSCSDMDG